MDLENWMDQLPQDIKKTLPIIYLAIPGTHNSITYTIDRNSGLSPDADTVMQTLYKLFPSTVAKWAKTQNYTEIQQLKAGIRYFDLRVAKNSYNNKFYFCHGLYSRAIFGPLQNMEIFLRKRPNELIILDFQHFYNVTEYDHQRIAHIIRGVFREKLYGQKDGSIFQLTLSMASELRKQVIVIYRETCVESHPDFFSTFNIESPWPNLSKYNELINFLERVIYYRNAKLPYVLQCIYTPNFEFIMKRPLSSLEQEAYILNKDIMEWIRGRTPGNGNSCVNILMGDFIDYNENEFSRSVVELNYKLLGGMGFK